LGLGFGGRKGRNDDRSGNGSRVGTERAEIMGTVGIVEVYVGVGP
jgi:hypothetical protein